MGLISVRLMLYLIVFIFKFKLGSTSLLQESHGQLLAEGSLQETIDDIITPSDTCKEIVRLFGSAISNFTLCSVTNARPIHLCQWCIHQYLRVVETHQDFTATIDEKGNPCQEYFTNLDRIEIVTDAYRYVHNLWTKGKCDYCFRRNANGTIIPRATEDAVNFDLLYQLTKSCFDRYINTNNTNDTCVLCKENYNNFNNFYIEIGEKDGENICLDIVDTMNTTREIWSGIFNCVPNRLEEFWLHVGMGIVGVLPVIFYLLAFLLSNVQEASVLHQRRLIETMGTINGSSASTSLYTSAGAGTSAVAGSSRSGREAINRAGSSSTMS